MEDEDEEAVMDSTNTWEVPRERWATFLSQVEALQRDKPVELELAGPEIGDQPLARDVQLRAISAAPKGASAGAIELDLGMDGGLDHRVIHPSHLHAVQAPSGQLECLEIEDESHTKTLVRFKVPRALPVATGVAPKAGRDVLVSEHMTSPARVLATGSSLARAFELMRRHGIRHLPVVDHEGHLQGILSDRDIDLAKRERGIPPEDVTVDETMTRSPYTVTASTRLDEAAAVMAQRRYGCAVVVEGGRVVGILTTTDALRALVQLRAQERGEWL